MFRLLSYDKSPPGEFQYEQSARPGTKPKRWKSPLALEMAGKIAEFRAGNKLPRASKLEALEDISNANCARLGYASRWCYDSDVPFGTESPLKAVPGCSSCGAKIT